MYKSLNYRATLNMHASKHFYSLTLIECDRPGGAVVSIVISQQDDPALNSDYVEFVCSFCVGSLQVL